METTTTYYERNKSKILEYNKMNREKIRTYYKMWYEVNKHLLYERRKNKIHDLKPVVKTRQPRGTIKNKDPRGTVNNLSVELEMIFY
jgi:hypothetical protein